MKIIFYFTLILVITVIQNTSAQRYINGRAGAISPWEIGFSSGVSSFMTSVNQTPGAPVKRINYWHNDLNPVFSFSVARNFSPALGVEINWLNTHLTGQWNDRYPAPPISAGHESPLKYNSQINQFDLMIGFNINQIILPGDDEDIWHLFFKTGVGISDIKDTKKFYPGINYSRMSAAFDIGCSVSLNEYFKIKVGSIFRIVKTDNLDGVHVVSTDLNGNWTEYSKIFEIYNYTYL